MKKVIGLLCLLLVFMSATAYASAAAKKDTKAPVVTKTNPVDTDADVMIESSIYIRFSEAVKKGSKIKDITLKESDLKKVNYSYELKDNFLILKPKDKLKYNTFYTVAIPAAAVQDLAGNKLAKEYSFTFLTEQDPAKEGQEAAKTYKYFVELELNTDYKLEEDQFTFYSTLLKSFGFDANFKSVKEITPTPAPSSKKTPTPTPKVSNPPTPIITPELKPTKTP